MIGFVGRKEGKNLGRTSKKDRKIGAHKVGFARSLWEWNRFHRSTSYSIEVV